jgi:beta-barrel assembly-enhancing protease
LKISNTITTVIFVGAMALLIPVQGIVWNCRSGALTVPVEAIAQETEKPRFRRPWLEKRSRINAGASSDAEDAAVRQQARQAAHPIVPFEEYRIGRAVAAKILGTYPLYNNEEITRYVNTVGQVLALHSSRPRTVGGYHFAILDTPKPNAFACPGGIILLTRGLVELCESEDELAAVIAHEVAHLAHRDGVKSIRRSRWAEAKGKAVAEKLEEKQPKLAELVSHFGGSVEDVFQTMVVNGYSRQCEKRADLTAIEILRKAGYNPAALISVLTRMEAAEQKGRGMPRTHPPARLRLQIVKTRVSPTPQGEQEKIRTQRFQRYFAQK